MLLKKIQIKYFLFLFFQKYLLGSKYFLLNLSYYKEVKLICKVEKGHAADINGVTWHPKDENILATCGDDNVVKLWALKQQSGK